MTDPDHASSADGRPDDSTGPASALDWARRMEMTPAVLAELRVLARRRQRRQLVGFTLGLAAAVAVMIAVVQFKPAGDPAEVKAGELAVFPPRQQTLPDGSVVDLKDGAEIEIDFTPALRRVALRRGAAHFAVAKNPDRPFIVVADGVAVRAVGTAFCVDLMHQAVDVLVTEGRVSVTDETYAVPDASPGAVRPRHALVGAGERVVVDQSAEDRALKVEPIRLADLDAKLGWRMPKLDFFRTPLADVLASFNRYNERKLVLQDTSLGGLRVSGTLRADKTGALLEMLRQSFELQVEDRGEGDILIRR